jgi:hypothetical protein
MKIVDTSGEYDETLNPTGWGTPNAELEDVSSAILEITYPNGTTVEQDVTDTVREEGTFPDLYILNPIGTTFPDGIYSILYTVVMENTTVYTATSYISIDCTIACCVEKMFAELPNKMCDTCNYTEYVDNALLAEALLLAYRSACSCGDSTKANSLLVSLQKICDWSDCSCS